MAQTKAQAKAQKEVERKARARVSTKERTHWKRTQVREPMKKNNPKESSMWVCLNLQAMEWVRFNLDTGAAQTAIPSDWADKVPVKEGTEVMFKTASGELVCGTRTGVFKGTGEFGHCCSVTGPLAPVHKPLVSAYKCLKHGRVAVLDEHGGNLIPQDSKVSGKILELIEKEKNKHHAGVPGEGCLQLLPEGEGTYSGFWAAAHSGVSPAKAMAAADDAVPAARR